MLQEAHVVGFDDFGYYNNKNRFGNGMHKPHPWRFASVQQAVPQNVWEEIWRRMTTAIDRHSAHFELDFLDHQVCFPHLLRVLVYLTEPETKQQWSKDVVDLLRKAIHERSAGPISRDIARSSPSAEITYSTSWSTKQYSHWQQRKWKGHKKAKDKAEGVWHFQIQQRGWCLCNTFSC